MLNSFTILILALLTFTGTPLSAQELSRVDAYLKKATANGYSGSVLIAEDGKVVHAKGYGMADREKAIPCSAETIFDIGSLTKQFTAAAVLKLEMQNKLKVTDSISKYLEGVPEDKSQITLHELLTHTAGLPDALGPDEELISREDYLRKAFAANLETRGEYAYSNVGYSLLAAIIEKVSGQDYEHYLRENIFLQAKMMHTGYVLPEWNRSKFAIGHRNDKAWGTTYDQSQYEKEVTWHLRGNGGILSTVGDLFLWAMALKGDSILSAEAKRKYFTPHVKEGPDAPTSYGYGWVIYRNERGETVITHNGGNGFFMATMVMIPEKDYVIVVFTNDARKNTDTMATMLDRIVMENYQGLTDDFARAYQGSYSLPEKGSFSVTFDENSAAIVTMPDSRSFLLLAGSDFDRRETAERYNSKTKKMLSAFLSSDFLAAEKESNVPAAQLKEMREQIDKEWGALKSFDVLGSVARREGRVYITAARIVAQSKELIHVYVWEGENLTDFLDMFENIKSFEFQKENQFFAENNRRTLIFSNRKGKKYVTIKAGNQEVIAEKIAWR